MLLKEYIGAFLSEAFSYNKLKDIVVELNSVVDDYYKQDDRRYDVYYDLLKVIDNFGLKKLGAGAYRKAYTLDGEDWVLKLAYGYSNEDFKSAVMDNAGEVNISQGDHGIGARDLFVQVYDWDRISDQPSWLLTQKVVSLEKAHKHFSITDIERIFPTLWSALKSSAMQKKNVSAFCDFVSDTFVEMSMYVVTKEKNSAGLSRLGFYRAMKEGVLRDEDLVAFEEVYFGEDFFRIAKACAYSRPDDMHSGNIGLVPSDNPSPGDVVVLDYMIDP